MSGAPAVMPFGKHKGTPLADLEESYFQWLAKQELRDPLKRQVTAELARRAQGAPSPAATPSRPPAPSPPPPDGVELLPEELQGGEAVEFSFSCPSCGRKTVVRGLADTK